MFSCFDLTSVSSHFLFQTSWHIDLKRRGSDHFLVLISLYRFHNNQQSRTFHVTDWNTFRNDLEKAFTSDSSQEEFKSILTTHLEKATRQITLSSKYLAPDTSYEDLRAIRRQADRRARKRQRLEHIVEAK